MLAPKRFLSWGSTIAATAALQLGGGSAWALQPLQQFIDGARTHSPDAKESQANLDAAKAQADATLGRQLPSLSVRGTYTYNQYDAEVPGSLLGLPGNIVITPNSALDAYGTVNIPLVDLASFRRISAARTSAESSSHQYDQAQLNIESQVIREYYGLVGNLALVNAAQRALDVAKASQKSTKDLVQAGKVASLDGDRADAEVERQLQSVVSAKYSVSVSAQNLLSYSGITPDLSGAELALQDDLHEEPALESFYPAGDGTPGMQAASIARVAAEKQGEAQRLVLVPNLSGSFTEHASNYAGFSGHDTAFQAVVALNWNLDYTTFANMKVQDANTAAAAAREERTKLQTFDGIHNAYEAVRSAIANSRSARAQNQATEHAQRLAKDRYDAGAATQLDLLQSQRDAFQAEVARIQADTTLVNARAQLRIAAGRDPFASSGATP